jgi:phage repressor protein C with HTH and peptisase S24 domain
METVKGLNSGGKPPEIARRLKSLVGRSGLSGLECAAALGISKGYLSRMLAGTQEPSREVLKKLASEFGADINELLLGRRSADGHTAYVTLFEQEAAAGRGSPIADYLEKVTIAVPLSFLKGHKAENVNAVRVVGDSMTDEKIYPGDTVFFDRSMREPDYISVVSVGATLLVKRVTVDALSFTLSLLSANPAYPPRVFSGSDAENVRIEGRVIGWLHKTG